MKRKTFLFATISLFLLLGGVGCEKKDTLTNPDTIGNILEVFELTYDNPKEIVYNNKKIEISLQNVKDNVTLNCELVDFNNNTDDPLKIRIHSYLKINNREKNIEVISKTCGALPYKNNTNNIQDVIDIIDVIRLAPANSTNSSYFKDNFINTFGDGTIIENTPYRIFMAKAFPIHYNQPNASLEDYKFIFILTFNQ